jgi:hypothetical protein
MKIEFSRVGSSPDGIAALAIVTAMIDSMPTDKQRSLLSRTGILLGNNDRAYHREAARIIAAMLAQLET